MTNLLKRAVLACAMFFALALGGGLTSTAVAGVCTTATAPNTVGSTVNAQYEQLGNICAAFADIVAISATPTVSTSPAYSSGDVLGGLLTFSGAARSAGGSGLVQSVAVNFKSAQTAALDFLWCGSSNLPATTLTDNAALAVAAGDFAACRAIHVTDCTSLGTPSTCSAEGIAVPFTLAAGTTGYGVLVTRGTQALASTSDVTVTIRLLRNNGQ